MTFLPPRYAGAAWSANNGIRNNNINQGEKMKKLPHEKLGLSETAFLLAYTRGYGDAYRNISPAYAPKSAQRKAYDKGRRDAKSYR